MSRFRHNQASGDPIATPLDLRLEREEREKHAFLQLTEAEKANWQMQNYLKYSTDNWAFLADLVWTKDQVDNVLPIKPYPGHLEYLRFFVMMWNKYKLLAAPKSRRMHASWTCIPLYLHDALFNPHRHIGFVSKKEEDSYELVLRAEHVYKHIPEWRLPKILLPKIKGGATTRKPPILAFEENGSKIQGFPQGEDQLRQFTLSGIFEDECAFWEEAEGSYAGAKPTTEGGGRLTMVSSRAPGFFKKVVFDQLNALDYNFPETPPAPSKSPMTGVEVWKNPKNGFLVLDLHYTANPTKQSKEWRDAIANGMPIRKFMMEYEKTWETYEGKPVYEDFVKPIHSTTESLAPEPGLPLLLGVDFGLTPAMVLCQLVGDQFRVLREFVEPNGAIRGLATKVWRTLNVEYGEWTRLPNMIYTFIDPAGLQRAQTDESTCAMELRKAGFVKVLPGPVDWESRRGSVDTFLTTHTKRGPGLIVSEKGCPTLVQGFTGGYHYPERVIEVEPSRARPLKNSFSHPHDALQYVAAGALSRKGSVASSIDLTTPSYGFQQGAT